ncbi:MAG: ABC transporter permease subunit [Acetatifactor sp.]
MSQLGILYQYEMKKILKRKMTWIAFIGAVLIMLIVCYEALLNNYSETNAQTGESVRFSAYDRVIQRGEQAEKLNGRLIDDALLKEMQTAFAAVASQETMLENGSMTGTMITAVSENEAMEEKLAQQRRLYDAVYNYVRGVVGNNKVHTVDAAAFYDERQRTITAYEDTEFLTGGEREYWRGHERQTPYPYYWDQGPSIMLACIKTLLALLALVIGMVFSGVFADEHMRKTDQLALCSRHGRGMLYRAKLLAAVTLGVAATFIVGGVTLVSFGILYGYGKNWNAPLQMHLETSPYALTMGEAIVIMLVLLLLSALLHSVLTLVLSAWTKSSVATMSLMTAYILGTVLISVPGQLRALSQSVSLLPAQLVRGTAFCDMRLVGGAGHYLTNWQTGMLLYPLLTLGLALLGSLLYRRWQISGR